MTRIEPNALYSRDELRQMLAPFGVSVPTFVRRLGLKQRKFKQIYLGEEILEGFRRPETMVAAKRANVTALVAAKQNGKTRTVGERRRAGK